MLTIAIAAAAIKLGPARLAARLNSVGTGSQMVGRLRLFGAAFYK